MQRESVTRFSIFSSVSLSFIPLNVVRHRGRKKGSRKRQSSCHPFLQQNSFDKTNGGINRARIRTTMISLFISPHFPSLPPPHLPPPSLPPPPPLPSHRSYSARRLLWRHDGVITRRFSLRRFSLRRFPLRRHSFPCFAPLPTYIRTRYSMPTYIRADHLMSSYIRARHIMPTYIRVSAWPTVLSPNPQQQQRRRPRG